jgi:hypothetical protein
MDRDVYFIVNGEDYFIGNVADVLSEKQAVAHELLGAVRDVVDTLVYDVGESDYTVCSIEVR